MSTFKSPLPTTKRDQKQPLITAQKKLQKKDVCIKPPRDWSRVQTISLLKQMSKLSLAALGGHLYRPSMLPALSTVGSYYQTLLEEIKMLKKYEIQQRGNKCELGRLSPHGVTTHYVGLK